MHSRLQVILTESFIILVMTDRGKFKSSGLSAMIKLIYFSQL